MAMSKKDFVALADHVRCDLLAVDGNPQSLVTIQAVVESLADFCQSQNPAFKRERWLGYIRGENGKNGGAIKKVA